MNIKFNKRQEIHRLIIIVTILFSISTYSIAYSLIQDGHKIYEIDNVKQVEDFSNLADSEVDKYYRISESGLSNQEKQKLMNEKSVVVTGSSTFETINAVDETVALTTNNSAYIGDIDVSYPSSSSVGFFVALLISALNIMVLIDDFEVGNGAFITLIGCNFVAVMLLGAI